MKPERILLVEDDADLGGLLSRYLAVNHFVVDLATDSQAALQLLSSHSFDLVVLDVMLPGNDGFSLAAEIKKIYPALPFIFLTARRQQADVLRGLGIGADDYMIKPFDADELILRIRNILKRSGASLTDQPQYYRIGHGHFEPKELRLTMNGQSSMLTSKEAALLELLCRDMGGLIRRKDILEALWGSADFFNGRSLDVFISRLRKLLEADQTVQIEVIRGEGFILKIISDA